MSEAFATEKEGVCVCGGGGGEKAVFLIYIALSSFESLKEAGGATSRKRQCLLRPPLFTQCTECKCHWARLLQTQIG